MQNLTDLVAGWILYIGRHANVRLPVAVPHSLALNVHARIVL